jgi:hypothetical protein
MPNVQRSNIVGRLCEMPSPEEAFNTNALQSFSARYLLQRELDQFFR